MIYINIIYLIQLLFIYSIYIVWAEYPSFHALVISRSWCTQREKERKAIVFTMAVTHAKYPAIKTSNVTSGYREHFQSILYQLYIHVQLVPVTVAVLCLPFFFSPLTLSLFLHPSVEHIFLYSCLQRIFVMHRMSET